MQKQIIKLLKDFESGYLVSDHLKTRTYEFEPDSSYEDCVEFYKEEERNKLLKYISDAHDEKNGYYDVVTYIHIPNTQYLLKHKSIESASEGFIRAELRRMESDGLIIIGEQKAQRFVIESRGDFSWFTRGNGWVIDTDSIVLTTKGKNPIKHLARQLNFWALIISIISLAISIYFNFPNS